MGGGAGFGGFGQQQGGFGGQQQGGFGGQQQNPSSGVGGFGRPQGGFNNRQGGFGQQAGFNGFNPQPQFQNPYGPPQMQQMYTPYSQMDQNQFGFQQPQAFQSYQQQQQARMFQNPYQQNPYQQNPYQQQRGFGNARMNQQPQQPPRPAFLDNPEYQGYQKQAQDLNNQLNDYTKQSPIFQQLQDLQGKLRGFESPQQAQQAQQTNTDLLRRLGNPMPGTPEHNLRYPEIGTPEFEQLHGPGANAEAQRSWESGPITTMPVSPPPESVAEEFNPETYQRNPNLSKPYMPQRQMTPEQQRMQNIKGLYTPDHYQQQQQPRGMTMDMPQYGRDPFQSMGGLGSLGNLFNRYGMQRGQQTAPPGMERRMGMGGEYFVPAGTPYNPLAD